MKSSKAVAGTGREGFEKWANAKGTMGNSWNGEYYENKLHRDAWQVWQAATAAERERSIAIVGQFVGDYKLVAKIAAAIRGKAGQ